MKFRLWIVTILLAFGSGCGDDDSPVGPDPDPTPPPDDGAVPTAVGVPDGTPTSATIGAAGGTLASSDALFTVTIPAGALAAETEIGIQPITNTAWGGLGPGYRLTPDGQTFAAPIELVFTISDEVSSSIAFAFLDAAVQNDAGFWYVLKNKTLDESAGTVTCTTTHFSDYSTIAGVQILPPSASIATGQTVTLNVRHCTFETYSGDPDLVSLVASCDDELAPLGTFSNWSVNGVAGGGASSGTIAESANPQSAVYTAPATVPGTNPVAVSVQTNFEGNSALLVSNITVTGGERWIGTTVFSASDGTVVTADITWEYESTHGSLVDYMPTGTVTYTPPPTTGDCTNVSVTPNSRPLAADDGFLSIDMSANPQTFYGDGVSVWPATWCTACPPVFEVDCGDLYVGGQWMMGFGLVTNNGTTITGTENFGGGVLTYTFTKSR